MLGTCWYSGDLNVGCGLEQQWWQPGPWWLLFEYSFTKAALYWLLNGASNCLILVSFAVICNEIRVVYVQQRGSLRMKIWVDVLCVLSPHAIAVFCRCDRTDLFERFAIFFRMPIHQFVSTHIYIISCCSFFLWKAEPAATVGVGWRFQLLAWRYLVPELWLNLNYLKALALESITHLIIGLLTLARGDAASALFHFHNLRAFCLLWWDVSSLSIHYDPAVLWECGLLALFQAGQIFWLAVYAVLTAWTGLAVVNYFAE